MLYLSGYLFGDGSVRADQIRLYGTEADWARIEEHATREAVTLTAQYSLQKGRKIRTWVTTWPQRYRDKWPKEVLELQRAGTLPIEFFLEEPTRIIPFVEGLWDSDGCVSILERKGRTKPSQKVTFVSAKPPLAFLARDLLFELGIESTTSVGRNHRGETMAQTTVKSTSYDRFKRVLTLQDKKQKLLEQLI